MRRRFFVLFNPGAGRSRRALLDKVTDCLLAAGAEVRFCDAPDPAVALAEAARAVQSGGFDAIVAAGGDGTVRQAAGLVAHTGMPLGYIPLGTGNVLAHELRMDRAPATLAATLLTGALMPVSCGLANGAVFLLMAGAGFDGRVIARLKSATKVRFGKMAYVSPVLQTLAGELDPLDVTIDGVHRSSSWVVVTNARHYGGHFVIAPTASLAKPGLQAVLFHRRSRVVLLRQLAALALGRLGDDVEIVECQHVQIRAPYPVPCQIDGDSAGTTPLEVSTGGGTVQLIVPPDAVGQL
jgi:diacylglycerol kinase (ATP)